MREPAGVLCDCIVAVCQAQHAASREPECRCVSTRRSKARTCDADSLDEAVEFILALKDVVGHARHCGASECTLGRRVSLSKAQQQCALG